MPKSAHSNNLYIVITMLLLVFNFLSSLSVIYIRHLNTIGMATLNKLTERQDKIYQEWTQLLLEQHTLISYSLVDKTARDKLAMHLPTHKEIIHIKSHEHIQD